MDKAREGDTANKSAEGGRALVVIPTYNERLTLPRTLANLRSHQAGVDVLIVDDSSPDGTARWVREQRDLDCVFLLSRPAKSGLASAYLDGFAWGMARGYEYLCQMDADGSHRAEDLARMLGAAVQRGGELVIGSRWIPGGATPGWSAKRVALSRLGNLYIRLMLGLGIKDATAGIRVYQAGLLRRMPLSALQQRGYGFQVEMTRMAARVGARILEVPIVFLERRAGKSKMDTRIVLEEFRHVTQWGLQRAWKHFRG